MYVSPLPHLGFLHNLLQICVCACTLFTGMPDLITSFICSSQIYPSTPTLPNLFLWSRHIYFWLCHCRYSAPETNRSLSPSLPSPLFFWSRLLFIVLRSARHLSPCTITCFLFINPSLSMWRQCLSGPTCTNRPPSYPSPFWASIIFVHPLNLFSLYCLQNMILQCSAKIRARILHQNSLSIPLRFVWTFLFLKKEEKCLVGTCARAHANTHTFLQILR